MRVFLSSNHSGFLFTWQPDLVISTCYEQVILMCACLLTLAILDIHVHVLRFKHSIVFYCDSQYGLSVTSGATVTHPKHIR